MRKHELYPDYRDRFDYYGKNEVDPFRLLWIHGSTSDWEAVKKNTAIKAAPRHN
jgi:lipoprotein NlpI